MNLPLRNGEMVSFSNIQFDFLSRTVTGVKSINYGSTRAIENLYGAGSQPIGRGSGPVEYTASIELYHEELEALQDAAPGGDITKLTTDITISFIPANGPNLTIRTHLLKNCAFKNNGRSGSQGDMGMTFELELLPSHIIYNA